MRLRKKRDRGKWNIKQTLRFFFSNSLYKSTRLDANESSFFVKMSLDNLFPFRQFISTNGIKGKEECYLEIGWNCASIEARIASGTWNDCFRGSGRRWNLNSYERVGRGRRKSRIERQEKERWSPRKESFFAAEKADLPNVCRPPRP